MIDAPAPSRAKAVTPERLRRFLTEHGFSELGTWGRFLERYQLKRDRPIDILVPTTLDIDDYARRIQDAIAELSGAFETPVGDIINELLSVEYQTFKIRAHPNEELASIPFSEGLGLLESSKELIRASAVSALGGGFRPIIRGRLPTVVDDFMDRVEIGQTEIGSYVFTLLLPNEQGILGANLPPGAQNTVASTLDGGMKAAQEMAATNRVPPQRQLEAIGLSANFFEALYDIVDWADQVSIELENTRDTFRGARYEFNRSALSILERTSERLAPEAEKESTRLKGTITRLNEPRIRRRGSLDLRVRFEGRERTIRVPFDFNDRDTVIAAFKEKTTKALSVRGNLKTGRGGHLVLEDPHMFQLIPRGTLI